MSVNILHSDSRLTKQGRWITDPTGHIYSGWAGSFVRFRVSGTATITVNVTYKGSVGKSPYRLTCAIDNGWNLYKTLPNVIEDDTLRDTSITLGPADGLTTSSHTVLVKCTGLPGYMIANQIRVGLRSIDVDNGATVTAWPMIDGSIPIQLIADSWGGGESEWTRYLPTMWDWYSVSNGGYTANDSYGMYGYKLYGSGSGAGAGTIIPANDDPQAAAVLIEFAVNDYNQSLQNPYFTLALYKSNILSLISQAKVKQPNAKICLVQLVDCPFASPLPRPYGTYFLSTLEEIVAADPSVYLIRNTGVDPFALTWSSLNLTGQIIPDYNHLSYESKPVWAQHISDSLATILGVSPPQPISNPYDTIPYIYTGSGMQVGGYGMTSVPAPAQKRNVRYNDGVGWRAAPFKVNINVEWVERLII